MAGLSWTITESAVDATAIKNNQTTVTVNLYVASNGQSWNANNPPGYIVIDGTKTAFNHSFAKSSSNQWIASASKVITHNPDGTKSISLSAAYYTDTSALGTLSISGTRTLATIPRASSHALVSGTNTIIGSPINFKIAAKVASFTHRVQWKFSTESAWRTLGNYTGSANFALDIPLSELTNWTNSASPVVQTLLTTYNGGTYIGQQQLSWTFGIPDSVKPTVSEATLSPVNTNNDFGLYLQGETNIDVVLTGEGVYGSTISEYKVAVDGTTVLTGEGGSVLPFGTAGEKVFTFSVKDSRGRLSDTTTEKITVTPYFKPLVNQLETYRCNAVGNKDEKGAYIYVKPTIGFADCEGKNSVEIKAKYKRVADTGYGAEVTIKDTGSIIGPISTVNTYEILVYATDLLGYTTDDAHDIIPTEYIGFHLSYTLNAAAVGKYSEYDNTFENGFDRFLSSKIEATEKLEVAEVDYTIYPDEYDELLKLLGGG